MADEEHIIRNSAGTIVAVMCTKCNRVLEGDKPRRCDDCADGRSTNAPTTAASGAETT